MGEKRKGEKKRTFGARLSLISEEEGRVGRKGGRSCAHFCLYYRGVRGGDWGKGEESLLPFSRLGEEREEISKSVALYASKNQGKNFSLEGERG